ncbi:hypothetical protein ACWGDE_07570 [Streptomyces sp. NPDC054956]
MRKTLATTLVAAAATLGLTACGEEPVKVSAANQAHFISALHDHTGELGKWSRTQGDSELIYLGEVARDGVNLRADSRQRDYLRAVKLLKENAKSANVTVLTDDMNARYFMTMVRSFLTSGAQGESRG